MILERPTPFALFVAALGVLAVLAIHITWGIPVGDLTRDPAVVVGAPAYAGLLSHVGVLLWFGSATVMLFAASRSGDGERMAERRRLLRAFAALTVVLALDDLFMLHELVFPQVLGVPELATLAAYVIAAAIMVLRFRHTLAADPARVTLALAFVFFAAALLLDVAVEILASRGGRVEDAPPWLAAYFLLVEDGFKFAGIACWTTGFAAASIRLVDDEVAMERSAALASGA